MCIIWRRISVSSQDEEEEEEEGLLSGFVSFRKSRDWKTRTQNEERLRDGTRRKRVASEVD